MVGVLTDTNIPEHGGAARVHIPAAVPFLISSPRSRNYLDPALDDRGAAIITVGARLAIGYEDAAQPAQREPHQGAGQEGQSRPYQDSENLVGNDRVFEHQISKPASANWPNTRVGARGDSMRELMEAAIA